MSRKLRDLNYEDLPREDPVALSKMLLAGHRASGIRMFRTVILEEGDSVFAKWDWGSALEAAYKRIAELESRPIGKGS